MKVRRQRVNLPWSTGQKERRKQGKGSNFSPKINQNHNTLMIQHKEIC
jgi:hypothetical protein